jgi:diguanylate cyclase (GGDEF)-like protein
MDNYQEQTAVRESEQAKKLERVRLAVDFFDKTFNEMQDSLLIINPYNYKIETFNQNALNNLGLSEDNLLGVHCYSLFYNQLEPCRIPFQPCPIRQSLSTRKPVIAEYKYTTPNKQKKEFEVSVNLIFEKQPDQYKVAYLLRDINARSEKNADNPAAVYKDQLTNLYNQVIFKQQLEFELSRSERYNRPLSLLALSLDDLANFDQLSLPEKSDFLRMLGEVINGTTRNLDSGYNCGVNKFQLILPETDGSKAKLFADRLKKTLKSRTLAIPFKNISVFSRLKVLSFSIGIASFKPGDNAETLTINALSALQNAKHEGGDGIYAHQ